MNLRLFGKECGSLLKMIKMTRGQKNIRFLSLVLVLTLVSMGNSRGQNSRIQEFNLNEDGVMINGYDLVSYFIGTPERGRSTIAENYQGVKYWFANEENRQIFAKNPDKFLPAYGGWCAYAMGDSGEKVKIDPETYKIVDSRLYLFYNFYFNNTLIDWNKDEANLQKKADQNWQKIIKP